MAIYLGPVFLIGMIWSFLLFSPQRKPGVAINKARNKRHRRAVKVGMVTTVILVVVLAGGAIVMAARDADTPAAEARWTNAALGGIVLAGWLGLAAYGITRLIFRIRLGEAKPSPQVPTPPPSAPRSPETPDFSGLG